MKKPLGRSSWPGVAHRLAPADVDPDLERIRLRRDLAATVKDCVDGIDRCGVWLRSDVKVTKWESTGLLVVSYITNFGLIGCLTGLVIA